MSDLSFMAGPLKFDFFPDGDDPGVGWLLVSEKREYVEIELVSQRAGAIVTRETFDEFRAAMR